MTVVFINSLPTSFHFAKKINPKWFVKNGFYVEFWDLSLMQFTNNKLNSYYGDNKNFRYIGLNHKIFDNIKDFKKSVDEFNEKIFFFSLDGSIYGSNKSHELLKYIKFKGHYLAYKNFVPDFPPTLKKLFIKILVIIKRKIDKKVILPDYYFGSGLLSRKFINFFYPNLNFISIASPVINWNKELKIKKDNYIVFIDETIGYEPDAKLLDLVSSIDLNGYYKRLNTLFDFLEQKLNLPVLIAASGKHIYNTNLFGERKIIYGKTFDLMNNANLLVGHTSLALEHNILIKKPIIFLDDISFTKQKRNCFSKLYAFKGNKAYFLDDITDSLIDKLISSLNVDNKIIERYYKESNVEFDFKVTVLKELNKLTNKI